MYSALSSPINKYRLSTPFYFVAPALKHPVSATAFHVLYCRETLDYLQFSSYFFLSAFSEMLLWMFFLHLLKKKKKKKKILVLFSYWVKTLWSTDGSGWPWNASLPLLPDFALLQVFFPLFKYLFWDVCVCLCSSQIDAIAGVHIHAGCDFLCRCVLFV